jgi:hypothetical protein
MYGQNTHLNEAMHLTSYVRKILIREPKNVSCLGKIQKCSFFLHSVPMRKLSG